VNFGENLMNDDVRESVSEYSPIKMGIYMLKNYGFIRFCKSIIVFLYLHFKQVSLDITKERTLIVNEYKISVIPNDTGISRDLDIFKIREPLTTKLISEELKKGMICLDVGSNIGYYALLENKLVGKDGKVIAIEPSPISYKYLKNNSTLQEPFNIETYNFAASSSDGYVYFEINPISNHSRVVSENEIKSLDNVKKINAKRLDSFFVENPISKIDFMRMDVEGYEADIYQGGRKTIQKHKPFLVVEVHKFLMGDEKLKGFLHMLKEDGYEVKYYYPRELDYPMIGTQKDIKFISIFKLIQKIENKSLPDVFHIHLVNSLKHKKQ